MAKTIAPSRLDRFYALVANEEDARVCKDISDEACRAVPRNFFTLILVQALTKLGDVLASPKTVLAWLLGYVGAPAAMTALLVPIRESGSMVPQLAIAAYVRRRPIRKWVWVTGSLLQAVAVAAMAGVAAFAGGTLAGVLIVAALILFSLSRGLCSVSSKDVLGKTVPKTRRGRLTGLSTALSGLAAAGFGAYMLLRGDDPGSPGFYAGLLLVAGGLWVVAALAFAGIREEPGATEGGANALAEALSRLDLLRTDAAFRRFVIARALMLGSALSAPYFVVLAQAQSGGGLASLGLFILAAGLASSLGAGVWGYLADVSSRRVLVLAATAAASVGVGVFLVDTLLPELGRTVWLYPAAFLLLNVAHSGVRVGRKTYLVDLAGGNKRTDYVAVSNTVIGIILLMTGLVGALSSVLSPSGIILVLSLFGFAGALLGRALPEVQS
jgi:hypothetical protein